MKQTARLHTFIITLLLSVASFTVHAESQPSSDKAGDEKTATIEQNTQASNSPTMTKSEIEERIKEIDAKGSEITRNERFERIDLLDQLIAIKEAENAELEAGIAEQDARIAEQDKTIQSLDAMQKDLDAIIGHD